MRNNLNKDLKDKIGMLIDSSYVSLKKQTEDISAIPISPKNIDNKIKNTQAASKQHKPSIHCAKWNNEEVTIDFLNININNAKKECSVEELVEQSEGDGDKS